MGLIRTLFVLAFVTTLTACSTPADLRAKGPIYTATSTKDSAALAGCIADDLERQNMRNVQVRPTTDGYSVMRMDQTLYGPDTVLVVDVLKKGQTNQIAAYSALLFAAGDRMIIEAVKNCQ